MSKITESFGSGIALQYSAVASMFISSTIFYFLIAHLLSITLVGSISLLYAMMSISTVFFVFGFSVGIEHFISYHLFRDNFKNIRMIIKHTAEFAVLTSILSFIVIYYIAPLFANEFFHSSRYIIYIRIMDVGISGYILINLFSSILLGLNQYRKYSLSYIFVNIFSYFFPIALLLLQRKAIFVIVGITIANIIDAGIFICLVSGVYRKISSTGKSEIIEPYRSLVIYSFPLFFASLMTTGSTYLDRIVVSYFLNLSYLGIYNFALVIASAASVFIMPITNLLIPKLSSYFSLNDRKGFRNSIRTLLNIASLIYIPTAMGIASLSKITLYNFAGKAYVISYIPLIIIMFVTSLCIGAVILASGIKSIRKSRLFIFSSGMSLLSNIILSVLLIPRFNIIGASIAYSSMTAVNFIIIYSYARKMNVANYDKKSILKIWISSLIMFFFIFLIQSYFAYTILNEFIYIITGILLFSIEIRVFRLIGPEELKFIFSVIPEKLVKIRHIVGILSGEA